MEKFKRRLPPPENPPLPIVRKRPFQSSGNQTSAKAVEFAFVLVVIFNSIRQNEGRIAVSIDSNKFDTLTLVPAPKKVLAVDLVSAD